MQKDWELNPDGYQKNLDGTFKLKLDGTPKKKAGRKTGPLKVPYNFSKKQKAAQALQARIRTQQRKATRDRKKADQAAKRARELKAQKKLLKDGGLVTTGELKSMTSVVEVGVEEDVAFKPNEGPQTEFLAAPEKDVLYGGQAGGGKSYSLLADPLRYVHRGKHRALLLRRTMPELRELIDNSRELYPKAFKGAKFKEVEKTWTFPSGAKMEFGFLERDADVYRYQGQSYSWIGFDEITQVPTDFAWNYLASRLRTTDTEIQCYMRCTANPGGVGSHWVKKRYIDPVPPNVGFTGDDGVSRRFIPAKLSDNPYLTRDGSYQKMLESLPPILRKQLLEGDWDVAEGAAFLEFDYLKHVIPPFEIPLHWERVKGIDYGYASESACVWGAVDPSDGTLVIYRELYRKGLTAVELGQVLAEMERTDPMSIHGILDTACWSKTGSSGPSIAESIIKTGHKVRRADKNRIAGKIQVHEYLKTQHTGRPKIQIFNTCPNLVRELQSIPLAKNNPEDVDTHAPDHAYDALRYLIMSRPRHVDPRARMNEYKRSVSYAPADNTFGY